MAVVLLQAQLEELWGQTLHRLLPSLVKCAHWGVILLTCSVAFMSARKQQSQDTLHMVVRGGGGGGAQDCNSPKWDSIGQEFETVKKMIKVDSGE